METKDLKIYINDTELPYNDYDCSNVLTYIVSPERQPDFSLNADEIVHKYVPQITVKINYLTSQQYVSIIQQVNTPHFSIRYYDYELMKSVVRDMYCSDNSLDSVNAYSSEYKGTISVTLNFVSLVAYKDYEELLNKKMDFVESVPTKIIAKLFFNNGGMNIDEIITARTSTDCSWGENYRLYDKSLIGDITSGQNCLVVGTALDGKGKNILSNHYQGMILIASKSSDTPTNEEYKMQSDVNFFIKCSGDGVKEKFIYIQFDEESDLYATELKVNNTVIINHKTIVEIPIQLGTNEIQILALNKPNQYCKINAIFSSLVIDFVSGKDLISFNKKTQATDENGKAYYSLNASHASLEIYDSKDIISSLADEKRLTNDTYVEIYLTNSVKSDVKLIGKYYTNKFTYSDSYYNKRISIELKDPVEFTNSVLLTKYEKNNLDYKLYDGTSLLVYLLNQCNKCNLKLEISDNLKEKILSIRECRLNKLSANLFEQLNSICKMLNVYMWSNADGKIRIVEGE